MSDTVRLTLPDGRAVEAPVAVWLSAFLQTCSSRRLQAVCEIVARVTAARILVPAAPGDGFTGNGHVAMTADGRPWGVVSPQGDW